MNKINTDTKILLTVQLCALAAGFAVCFMIDPMSAVVISVFAAICVISEIIVLSKRRRKLSKLCDEVDKILHGIETVSFEEFKEGELAVLSSELHKMTIKLREQNFALKKEKQFLKENLEDISHQIRTPLTTVLVILGMLRQDISEKERTEHISEMFTLLSKMQWLLETLLNISRLDAGAVTLRYETVSATDIIDSALYPLLIPIELKNITLYKNTAGNFKFNADRQYLTEALENILKNCVEHTPENGEIRISAEENNIYTQITVSDTGAGIPEEELSRVFERFYRGKGFSSKGYGIGLAFAKKAVAMQNGTLSVKNAREKGAIFEMRIYKSQLKSQ